MSKTVLVTGASRGIGREIAWQFSQNGYRVAINYNHSKENADSLSHKIVSGGGVAEVFQADVSDYEQVKHMTDRVYQKFGFIDVLVNNAGISEQLLFTDITPKKWADMINHNLTSVYNCCHCVLPEMIRKHNGCIINIASMWGETGGSCEVHYSAAKAGIIGLTKALAKETGLSNIRVNCVSPGVIMTDMMSSFDTDTITQLKEETPLYRIGTAQDVANTVLFLADEKSSFITGQVISVNGGIYI